MNSPSIEPLKAPEPLPLKEVTALLIKRYGLHEGWWDIALEMQVAIGHFGALPDDILPGGMFRIGRIGLSPSPVMGPLTVDAAVVNPLETNE